MKLTLLVLLAALMVASFSVFGNAASSDLAAWGCRWTCRQFFKDGKNYVYWNRDISRCEAGEQCEQPTLPCTYFNIGVVRTTACVAGDEGSTGDPVTAPVKPVR